ncbi:hypothetical protein OQA88_13487 [Cercophora sp. LCS_1]
MAIAARTGVTSQLTKADREERRRLGVSVNYAGDISVARNLNACIPVMETCSFWLQGLPPGCTYHDLLSPIRGVGRIWSTITKPPLPPAPEKPYGTPTSAAKIVFFELEAAQEFLNRFYRDGFSVNGFHAKLAHNRVRAEAQTRRHRDVSRVVTVRGPKGLVNTEYLLEAFRGKFTFDMDEINTIWEGNKSRALEFRFGSFRAQAQSAHRLLRSELDIPRKLHVLYGTDPCA